MTAPTDQEANGVRSKMTAAIVLTLALAALPAAPASAARSLSPIPFTSYRNGNKPKLFLMNADGTRQRMVGSGFANGWVGSVSPDRTKIAFTSSKDALTSDEVYTVGADGRRVRRLAPGSGQTWNPSWSQNGKRIIYATADIIRMNADGSNSHVVYDGPENVLYPRYSPDGSKIMFTMYDGVDADWDIWTVNADGTSPTPVANDAVSQWSPSWSPNGSRIAYEQASEVWVANANGTGAAEITTGMTGPQYYPIWSPNRRIVFTSGADGDPEVCLIKGDGTGFRQLTHNTVNDSSAYID